MSLEHRHVAGEIMSPDCPRCVEALARLQAGQKMPTAVEPRRGRGRPAIGPTLTGVQVTQAVLDELVELAAAAGVKRAELVRTLLDEALAVRRRKAARRGGGR